MNSVLVNKLRFIQTSRICILDSIDQSINQSIELIESINQWNQSINQ